MLAVQATLVPILLKVDRRCRRDVLLQSVEITFQISPHSSIADAYLPTDIPIAPNFLAMADSKKLLMLCQKNDSDANKKEPRNP